LDELTHIRRTAYLYRFMDKVTGRFLQTVKALNAKGLDVKQLTLAMVLGTSQPNVSLIMNGVRNIPHHQIPEFCDHYNVNPNWIYKGEKPMFGEPRQPKHDLDQLWNEVFKLQRRLSAIEKKLK